ncbi:type VI secretion system baseplate subunit TssF, partial [Klebsiella quasipneumoniae]
GNFSEWPFDSLRLHLAGDRYISQGLYLDLLRHLQGIELLPLGLDGLPVCGIDGQPVSLRLGADQVQPVGFREDEALIPYPLNTFPGYRH